MKNPIIGIIGGKGKMGKYFSDFFERNGFKVLISDKGTTLSNKQLAKKTDVVLVSVPIHLTKVIIEEVAPHVKKTGCLMDLTSLKVFPMDAMKKAKASYFGCHPVFGPSTSIAGQLVIVCPGRGKKWLNWWKDILVKNKVNVRELSAMKHDKLMAYVQALTHFADIALADTFRKSGLSIKELMEFPSPVYRLEMDMMGRILNQNPKLYANIQIDNPLSAKVMNDFIASCQDLTKIVEEKKNSKFEKYFKINSEYLGDFASQAMIESDRLIDEITGSNIPTNPFPPNGGRQYNLAVLGPANSYSDMTARTKYPKKKLWYTASINEIFDLVLKGKIEHGLVPLENSLSGSVRETLDTLYSQNVWVSEVIAKPIDLILAGPKKVSLSKIKTIYSHPQPLIQAQDFLQKNCPKAVLIPLSSTSAALDRVARDQDPHSVAIGPVMGIRAHKLTSIVKSIQDQKNNITYFGLLSKKKLISKKANKTSIAITFKKDSPGSLLTILNLFGEEDINLTKLESRPNRQISGQYIFFIDLEGGMNDVKIKKTLKAIKRKVETFKVLGSYIVS